MWWELARVGVGRREREESDEMRGIDSAYRLCSEKRRLAPSRWPDIGSILLARAVYPPLYESRLGVSGRAMKDD